MGRDRYRIRDRDAPYVLTCTVLQWLLLFAQPANVKILLEYIHNNPVARGYVDIPLHWRSSSAGSYTGQEGLIEVVTRW